ncbi:aquaporin-like protein [Microstroma glucosiphilum]|uniref:Aquaporin-like protein n=1 Tax=Pseudomicrostroma glucosiphilum TaxID=1684307 RepID=A0A316U1E7_9BASI|nr:aquaporin-like protein [Pseudomicrostroma glucosiphilum]PWN19117.1 aquaporin-like protein [Pseudomicrostroma glucosiphilum]
MSSEGRAPLLPTTSIPREDLDSTPRAARTASSSSTSRPQATPRRPSRLQSILNTTRDEARAPPSAGSPRLPAQPLSPSYDGLLHNPRWTVRPGKPNLWARTRKAYHEELAEFLGTALILILGAGVECQGRLHFDLAGHDYSAGDYNSGRFGWAVGVALGVWIAGGVSGAHLNPTVTISLWFFRGFPARRVIPYILAQILGGFFGSALAYSNYHHSISVREGSTSSRTVIGPNSTAGLFVTFPQSYLDGDWLAAAWSEALASAVLVCAVFALSDKGGLGVPKGIMPIAMFLTLLGIGSALGINTGYAINFARDFGPRLFLSLMGYPSTVFTHNNYWCLWGPGLASIIGGLVGGGMYDVCVYTGEDSPVNRIGRGQGGEIALETEEEEEE